MIILFSKNIIFNKTWYISHNKDLLSKTKFDYLQDYKYKIFIFYNYNNLNYFIDIKVLILNKFNKPKTSFDFISKSIIIKKDKYYY